MMLHDVVADRVHQVRLAEPHAAVDEERVVRARRRFGDGAARGVRELVRRADDEGVEGVAGIQARRRADGFVVRGASRRRSARQRSAGFGTAARFGLESRQRLRDVLADVQVWSPLLQRGRPAASGIEHDRGVGRPASLSASAGTTE